MIKAGRKLIRETFEDIEGLIKEGYFEKALSIIAEYQEFLCLVKESEYVVDEYEAGTAAMIKAQAEATIRAQNEAEAKKQAEAELKAKEEAELIARIQAEAEAKVRAEIKAENDAKEKAKAEAEANRKARAEAATKSKKIVDEEIKLRAEAEAKARSKIKAEEEAKVKLKMPLFEHESTIESKPAPNFGSFFDKLSEDDEPKKAKDKKGFFESAKDAGSSFFESLTK